MSAASDFAEVTARLATIANIIRARFEDLHRQEQHGITNGEREAKLAGVVVKLRKFADELEKAI